MRKPYALIFIPLLLFCFTANISGIAAEVTDGDKPDTRLSQKVTYEAKHKPVKVILADLSRMTGVTLKAGASEQDWQVRDRKMNIFAKDLPLLSLMNSMARVMRFTWSKNAKVDPPIYRFYTDRRKISEMTAEQRAWLGGKVSCFPTTTARRPTTGARAKWLHGEVRLWKKLSAIS